MKSHVELTKRQLQVLPYLLSCPTYEEAARQAHVSVKQIYCWLKTSAFTTNNHPHMLEKNFLVRYSLGNWFLKMENIEPQD